MQTISISDTAGRPLNKQEAIAQRLKARILSGEMRPGARWPTRQAMLQAFGVSVVTLQQAMDRLRDDGFIVTRGRLGSFVADAPPHLSRYGLVFPCYAPGESPAQPQWRHLPAPTRFMDAMAQAAATFGGAGGQELVCYMGADRELDTPSYRRLFSDIRARRLAGVIFLHPNSAYTPELFAGSGIPSIVYAGEHPLPGTLVFHIDLAAFIDQALDHLVAQGRQRLAMLTIPGVDRSVEDHFLNALAIRGLPTGPHAILGLDPQEPHWARNAVAILLNQVPARRPDGLIISDDHLVEAATQGLLENGAAVPQKVAVVAHCNFVNHLPAKALVTQLGFDVADILRTCVRQLEARRRGESVPAVTRIAPVFAPKAASGASHSVRPATGRRLAHAAAAG